MVDWHRFITPSAWVQLGSVDWDYDKTLNSLLDNHEVKVVSEFRAKVGELVMWTGNFPYSYAHPYGFPTMLPSVKTRKRVKSLVFKSYEKKCGAKECK